jgi:hypothetical protein
MCEQRVLPPPKVHSIATVTQVVERPVCALAVAIYASEGWPD